MNYQQYIEGSLRKSHKKLVKAGQIGHRSRLRNFATYEILQNSASQPCKISAVFLIILFLLHFPSDFDMQFRVRLGFFVFELPRIFWLNLARKSTKIATKCD